jgi:hypothetical protein
VVIVARVITVDGVLDGHMVLDIECLDRIYLNAYVPILQTSSQVVAFLSGHLGFPFPSPALFRQMGDRFHHLGHAGPRVPGRHRGNRPKIPGSGLIPVTLGEVRRLLAHLITTTPSRTAAWA